MTDTRKPEELTITNNTETAKNLRIQEQFSTTKSIMLIQEVNGPKGLEPTRYGDWERKGRCVDF
ncbi:succinate dehydrogenase assembly factor 4 [Methylomonas sp. AM2-LC]|uniref:DUF1674 domain-containing protein n=1 Tax=Methylomonas sp. AM2-LC TaxID=3153301 RepID=UPI00326459F9